jgi:hypothetical protein
MKYIKIFESKTLVEQKMDLLDSLFLELYDEGFDYNIIKGRNNWMSIPIFKDSSLDRNLYPESTSVGDDPKYRRYHNLPSKLIYVVVTKEVRRFSDSNIDFDPSMVRTQRSATGPQTTTRRAT